MELVLELELCYRVGQEFGVECVQVVLGLDRNLELSEEDD